MNVLNFTLSQLLEFASRTYGDVEVYNALKTDAEELGANLEDKLLAEKYDQLGEKLNEVIQIAIAIKTRKQETTNPISHLDSVSHSEVSQTLPKKQNEHLKHHLENLVDASQQ
ncbi:MAG: hypothetical protein ACRC2S_16260 [Waterburya sp.]